MSNTQNVSEKYSVSIPSNVNEKLLRIKKHYNTTNTSAIVSIGIELLNWVVEQQKEGFNVQAEKEIGNKIIIRELPMR